MSEIEYLERRETRRTVLKLGGLLATAVFMDVGIGKAVKGWIQGNVDDYNKRLAEIPPEKLAWSRMFNKVLHSALRDDTNRDFWGKIDNLFYFNEKQSPYRLQKETLSPGMVHADERGNSRVEYNFSFKGSKPEDPADIQLIMDSKYRVLQSTLVDFYYDNHFAISSRAPSYNQGFALSEFQGLMGELSPRIPQFSESLLKYPPKEWSVNNGLLPQNGIFAGEWMFIGDSESKSAKYRTVLYPLNHAQIKITPKVG